MSIDMDILYRNLDEFTKGVASVVEEYHAHNEVSNGVSVKWTDLASEHVDGCAGNGYSNCARHRVTVRYDSYYADFYFERAVIN